MEYRKEKVDDYPGIDAVNRLAFEGEEEMKLVQQLRDTKKLLLSMVACSAGEVWGHIAYSRGWIQTEEAQIASVALGPMAVHPDYQKTGIGTELIQISLWELKNMGEAHVFVLGHTWFYPRFGFLPAAQVFNITSVYKDVGDHFMGLELQNRALNGLSGEFLFDPAFEGV